MAWTWRYGASIALLALIAAAPHASGRVVERIESSMTEPNRASIVITVGIIAPLYLLSIVSPLYALVVGNAAAAPAGSGDTTTPVSNLLLIGIAATSAALGVASCKLRRGEKRRYPTL